MQNMQNMQNNMFQYANKYASTYKYATENKTICKLIVEDADLPYYTYCSMQNMQMYAKYYASICK